MSQTCHLRFFEGEKKGLPNLEALLLSGAGTKSRTRDPLITRFTCSPVIPVIAVIALLELSANALKYERSCRLHVTLVFNK